jgi:hypothetical protein
VDQLGAGLEFGQGLWPGLGGLGSLGGLGGLQSMI